MPADGRAPAVDYLAKFDVSRDQSPSALGKAWRRVALTLHPDHNPNDSQAPARFAEAKLQFDEAREAARFAPCLSCNGTGRTSISKGFHQVKVDCWSCSATGKKWPLS